MDLTTAVFYLCWWIGGLAIAFRMAEIGYPWLAVFVLLLTGSLNVKVHKDE